MRSKATENDAPFFVNHLFFFGDKVLDEFASLLVGTL